MKNILKYLFLSILIVSCSNSKKNVISNDSTAIQDKTVSVEEPKLIDNTEVVEDDKSELEATNVAVKADTKVTPKKKTTVVKKKDISNNTAIVTEVVKKAVTKKTEDVVTNNKQIEVVTEEVATKIEPVIEESKPSVDEKVRTFIDKERGVSGNWSLKQEGDNVYIVFHSNFKTKKGPDLKVFISKQDISTTNGKNAEKDAVLLKDLASNKGEQKYLIPSNIDISQYKSILIHCKKYAKLWGGGKLQ
jgi:hypothetical protein